MDYVEPLSLQQVINNGADLIRNATPEDVEEFPRYYQECVCAKGTNYNKAEVFKQLFSNACRHLNNHNVREMMTLMITFFNEHFGESTKLTLKECFPYFRTVVNQQSKLSLQWFDHFIKPHFDAVQKPKTTI